MSEKGLCQFSNHDAKGDNWRTEAESGDATRKGEPEAGAGRQVGCAGERRPAARKRAPVSAPLSASLRKGTGGPPEQRSAAGLPCRSEKTAIASACSFVSALDAQFCAG